MNITKTENEMVIVESGKSTLIGSAISIILGSLLIFYYFYGNFVFGFKNNKADIPFWIVFISLFFVAIGILLAVKAEKREVRLNKQGVCTFNKKRLIGDKSSIMQFNISDISQILLTLTIRTSNSTNDSMPRRNVSGAVEILLNNNNKLPLGEKTLEASSSLSVNIGDVELGSQKFPAPLENEAKQIAEFCGVNLVTNDFRTGSNIVDSIKDSVTNIPQNPTIKS